MLKQTPPEDVDTATRLTEQVGPTIAELAGVDTSKYTWFLPGVRRALRRWELDIIFHAKLGSPAHEKSGNPDRWLYRMQKTVEALHEQLKELIETGNTGKNDVLLNVGAKLEIELAELETGPGPSLAEIERSINRLDRAIYRATCDATHRRGALPHVDRYPGLRSLVVNLQKMAQCSGGNFTAHRKNGRKGTLVKALNEIRAAASDFDSYSFDSESDSLLASSLPAPDQHPIATYERLLSRRAKGPAKIGGDPAE